MEWQFDKSVNNWNKMSARYGVGGSGSGGGSSDSEIGGRTKGRPAEHMRAGS